MKVVKVIFKCNKADYPALVTALMRDNMAHQAEFDSTPPGRCYVICHCSTFHAEDTVSRIAESLNLNPVKVPGEEVITPAQLKADQKPVQEKGVVGQ